MSWNFGIIVWHYVIGKRRVWEHRGLFFWIVFVYGTKARVSQPYWSYWSKVPIHLLQFKPRQRREQHSDLPGDSMNFAFNVWEWADAILLLNPDWRGRGVWKSRFLPDVLNGWPLKRFDFWKLSSHQRPVKVKWSKLLGWRRILLFWTPGSSRNESYKIFSVIINQLLLID